MAIHFKDSTNDRLSWFGDPTVASGTPETISFFLKFTAVRYPTNKPYVISKGSLSGSGDSFLSRVIWIDYNATTFNILLRNQFYWGSTSNAWYYHLIYEFPINIAHHLVFTWDGTDLTTTNVNQTQALGYVNGVISTVFTIISTSGTRPTTNREGPRSLGGRYDDNHTDRSLDGDVWGVGVWDRVLSLDEIKQLSEGFDPITIPRGLIFAPKTDNVNNSIDRITGIVATKTNSPTTVENSSSLIYPRSPITKNNFNIPPFRESFLTLTTP